MLNGILGSYGERSHTQFYRSDANKYYLYRIRTGPKNFVACYVFRTA
jgi:hypothetical protein